MAELLLRRSMQSAMRRAVGFPALCLLLSLHAAGKGLPGRAVDALGDCTCSRTLGKAGFARKPLDRQSRTVLTRSVGARESCTCWKTEAENLS